jgi:hypothetical protein
LSESEFIKIVEQKFFDTSLIADQIKGIMGLLKIVIFCRTHFDFEVVTTAHEKRLLDVEIDATNRAIVLVVFFYEGRNSVVPKLNYASVKTIIYVLSDFLHFSEISQSLPGQNPRSFLMERKSFHASRFCLEISQHGSLPGVRHFEAVGILVCLILPS